MIIGRDIQDYRTLVIPGGLNLDSCWGKLISIAAFTLIDLTVRLHYLS